MQKVEFYSQQFIVGKILTYYRRDSRYKVLLIHAQCWQE